MKSLSSSLRERLEIRCLSNGKAPESTEVLSRSMSCRPWVVTLVAAVKQRRILPLNQIPPEAAKVIWGSSDSIRGKLNFAYYEGTFSTIPDMTTLTPIKVGQSDGFDLNERQQDDFFAFKFSGKLTVPTAGLYTFYTRSDDGSRITIHGANVITHDGLHAASERKGFCLSDSRRAQSASRVLRRTPVGKCWPFRGLDLDSTSNPSRSHPRLPHRHLSIVVVLQSMGRPLTARRIQRNRERQVSIINITRVSGPRYLTSIRSRPLAKDKLLISVWLRVLKTITMGSVLPPI